MAYERKDAAGAIPKTIVFYYLTDNVFNSVSLRSTMRARSVLDKEGEAQLDQVAISPDEKAFVLEALKEVIGNVFGSMFKITDTITENPFHVNEDYTPSGKPAGKYSWGVIVDNQAFNAALLQNIDNKIENCIRFFILTEWYIVCGLGDDAKLNLGKYMEYLKEAKNLTYELRRPLMT